MKTNSKHLGLVTKKFNDFFLVDLKNLEKSWNGEKFLCKVRKSINFKDHLIYVGDKVVIENAKYVPIVYDNGFDLIIAAADDDFPEESIKPTLEQLSENLRKGSRSGANVKIKIRKLEKISNGVSKPIVIGEVQKNVIMN